MSLPAKPVDGQVGVIKLGEGTATVYIKLRYNATRERWVGTEWPAIRSLDQVGVHLSLEPFTTKQYVPLDNSPTYGNDFVSPHLVGDAFAAGLTMEYRHSAWLAGNGSKVHVGAYFYELDDGDFNSPGGKSNAEENYTIPPSGGWAETTYITSTSTSLATPKWAASGWEPLDAAGGAGIGTAEKAAIYSAMYAFMDASPAGSALIYDYALDLRYIL